jgi:hypothetical protein
MSNMIDVANDKLISFRRVAGKFSVNIQTVNLWRRRGLECVKVGGKWFTTAAALNAFSIPSGKPSATRPAAAPVDPAHEEAMRELSQRFARR